MEARAEVLKRAIATGVLDALPLDALKLYLLLLASTEDITRESRLRLQTIQRGLGKDFSRQDCERALAALAAHRLLTWTPVAVRPSRRQWVEGERERLEVLFRLNPWPESG